MGMSESDLLIAATAAGPSVGALADRALTGSLAKLTRTRAQRVNYVSVSGADLYNDRVPLTEAQFREVFAATKPSLQSLRRPTSAPNGTRRGRMPQCRSTRYSRARTSTPSRAWATPTKLGSGMRRLTATPIVTRQAGLPSPRHGGSPECLT